LNQFDRRFCALALGAVSVFCTVHAARAQEQRPPRTEEPARAESPQARAHARHPPPKKSSVTHHDLSLDGKTLHYTATASTLLIRDGEDDHPYGSIFSVAYTLDGAEPTSRPVTFLYNGGPRLGHPLAPYGLRQPRPH
jgi:carboxypeptidase C (cathepsin A)